MPILTDVLVRANDGHECPSYRMRGGWRLEAGALPLAPGRSPREYLWLL